MKKLFNFLLRSVAPVLAIHLVPFLQANARPLSLEEAMTKAQHFMYSKSVKSGTSSKVAPMSTFKLAYEAKTVNRSISCFYVLNRTFSDGFVIVSADDRLPDVLGYSENGEFDINQIPDNMKWWLSEYERQIEHFLSSANDDAVSIANAEHRAGWTEVKPLIKSHWNQGAPYNDLCPTIDGTRTPTGCVATAMAQIMNYHQWPVTGRGKNSYEWKGQTLSMDFCEITFDWANMKDTYSDSNNTSEEANAVATLMYACGIGSKMEYGLNGSGASSADAKHALYKYFDYNFANYLYRDDDIELADWENIIYTELINKRPVFYESGSTTLNAHAFICDGYSSDGYFHINWGWGISFDGYFLLTALNPYDDNYYDVSQGILYNIYPIQKINVNGVYYALYEEEAVVIPPDEGYYTGDLLIPQTVTYDSKTYTVKITDFPENIWDYCQDLTSLTVYPHISELKNGYLDMLQSPHLKTVILHNVTHVNDFAFWLCSALETLKLGAVETIGERAFSGCSNLTTLELGNNLETIEQWAFENCSSLKELIIPDKVSSIGRYAFSGCESLNTLQLGNNLESIGSYAFIGCQSLTKLVIPDNVKSIGENAFVLCSNLTTLELGNNIETIGESTFSSCSTLKELIIPDKVKSIGRSAFSGCESLKTLQLGNNLEYIGDHAFSDCQSLTALVIPDNVKYIGDFAFYDCSNLTALELGNNLETIGNSAFWRCTSLKELIIPDKVKSIGELAFFNCQNLTTLQMSKDLEYIGRSAFANCMSLKELIIPDKVTSIGNNAFYGCNLMALQLGTGLEFIGEDAFYGIINRINSLNTIPPTIAETTFDEHTKEYATLYVPSGCKEIYVQTPYWNNFVKIEDITGITDIIDSETESIVVYTINGIKLGIDKKEDIKTLPNGIYIVNGKKYVVK